ncbi:MAG: hypothetical protein HA491_00680 [Candidatus Verstraetearchaeota archaeon]|nr:hypothetical protein [Candidatus Verstraetearchaeota archaeon]
MGGVSTSSLITGTPEKVEKTCEGAAPRGSAGRRFHISLLSSVPTEASPENVKNSDKSG